MVTIEIHNGRQYWEPSESMFVRSVFRNRPVANIFDKRFFQWVTDCCKEHNVTLTIIGEDENWPMFTKFRFEFDDSQYTFYQLKFSGEPDNKFKVLQYK